MFEYYYKTKYITEAQIKQTNNKNKQIWIWNFFTFRLILYKEDYLTIYLYILHK